MRKGQDDVAVSLMSRRDTVCVLPTGHGKSAAFIVPTLCLGWRTLVFSPLVALMRDQVKKLWGFGCEAAQMSGTQTEGENVQAARRWMAGELSFLYVAPERLDNEWFKQAVNAISPDMVVVDEAHTLSQWSDSFRPAYCKIGDFIRDKPPKVVAAFTATCPPEVEEDIRRVLCMSNAVKMLYYPRRKNLELVSATLTCDEDLLAEVSRTDGQIIVYCSTIKNAETTVQWLNMATGEEVGIYHGELPPASKRTCQDLFMSGQQRIMVATNAFGMGVDKADIRAVIHRNMPGSLEALAQEVGRAGRDGKPSRCMTFFDANSRRTQEFFIMCAYPSATDIRKVFGALERLSKRNKEGVIKVTHDDIAKMADVHKGAVGSCMGNLASAAVIEKSKQTHKICKVKILNDNAVAGDRFLEFLTVMRDLGVDQGNGLLEIDFAGMEQRLDLTRPTIQRYLREWNEKGRIYYEPPFRGSETRLIGGIDRVEFERLQLKQEQAYQKLEQVMAYLSTPDSQKHAFLEKYFGIKYDENA